MSNLFNQLVALHQKKVVDDNSFWYLSQCLISDDKESFDKVSEQINNLYVETFLK